LECSRAGVRLVAGLRSRREEAHRPAREDEDCNAQATEESLKGDERKAFMSECLKAKPMTQQEKMTACSKDATANLKGDERKAFMSECLKADEKS
jgi:psiF repeat